MTALIVLVGAILFARTPAFQWFVLKTSLRANFPQIRWLSTSELAQWLADPALIQPTLLDVRTSAEFEVSHLPNARRVEPDATPEGAAAGLAKETPIVTYCAVGFRSGQLARRLGAAGFTNVRNLEGSAFAWANEHRPLQRSDGQPTREVHPYSAWWGGLLTDDVRAPLPIAAAQN